MATKPFTIQSPEQIAKDYGGNKQKIAEAMQMGIVDPTAGTIAGMFIDRMRAAAQTEQTPQQTVAQQVFAPPAPPTGGIGMPAPPAPPMGGIGMPPAPDGASAGLGGTPEAAQMQAAIPEMGAPEMAPPEMPMEEAPMGMAEGGIAALPIPDTMFDEPDNGSYAGGGIVAFAAGGETDGQRYERLVTKLIPGTIVTSRQRSAADNARVGGVPNSYHKSDRARDFVPPPGMSLTEFGDKIKSILGPGHDVIYNSKGHYDHVHTEPGGKRAAAPTPREVDTNTFAGRGMSAEDSITLAQYQLSKLPREAMDRAKAAALEELSPESTAKEKRYLESKAIIAAGLTLMGGGKDYRGEPLGVSIANAAAVGLEAYGESREKQKAAKSAAVRTLMDLENVDRKTAVTGIELGFDAFKVGLTAEQQQRALDFQKVELISRIEQAGMDRASAEKIAGMRTSNPTQFESMMAIVMNGSPDQKLALETVIGLQKPQTGMAGLVGVDEMGGAGNANSGMTILGSKPA